MSAAPQPQFSLQSFPVTKKRPSSASKRAATVSSSIRQTQPIPKSHSKVTEKLSSKHNFVHQKQAAAKLKPLFRVQKIAFGIGSCLMIGSALVYISTVPIPQLWSQEYEQLKSLQRQERELTAANETIKNNLFQQAQQEVPDIEHQLSYLRPDEVIFLEKAQTEAKSTLNRQKNVSPFDSIPLSY